MGGFDYGRSQDTALRLIKRFGKAGKIARSVPGSGPGYDRDTATVEEHDCTLVVLEYSLREREGTNIGVRDRKVLVAAKGLAIEPVGSDDLVIDGESVGIVSVMPLRPADVTVLYEIQASF